VNDPEHPPSPAERVKGEQAFEQARTHTEAGDDLPAIDLSTFVLSLSHSALVHLGDAPNPTGSAAAISLPLARQTIDLLALLQDKTKGNLTGVEEQIMDQVLYELRMRYVEVAKQR
jgi:hypothetical protein